MSKIDKLNITGIRSFNTQRGETIQFYTPLTLIVGVNGSGKTTIIEALKYATSGELPPGAKKGGAFIHDPKLIGEKEVMAQAKLQFKSVYGHRMVVTRSLQLTITKTSRAQKALECSLLMDKNGEKVTVSTRVAQLDEVVPANLGVSKAVLENVIFCHQEESLWPMSEPLNLKKKFDEIFEADKYMKAIDNIKKIRKKHVEELGKYKILEEHAKADRDRAERARQKAETLSDEIEELRTTCQDLDKKMEQAQKAADNAWTQSESYAEVLGSLAGKRIEAQHRSETIEELEANLKEVTHSDEWLLNAIQQFDQKMKDYVEDRQTKRGEWLEWKDTIEEHRENLLQKQSEKGRYEYEKQEYERALNDRKDMVKDAAVKHQMRGYDDLTDEKLVEEFLFKIRKIMKEQNSALERARTSADSERQDALSHFNSLTERKKALQENKVNAKNQMASNDREANEYQQRANQIRVDEGNKAVIESRIDEVKASLQSAQELARNSNLGSKLIEANQELRNKEDERSRLNAELIQGTKRVGEVAKLAHLKQQLKERQQKLQTLTNTHADHVRQLVEVDWTPSTLDSVYQTSINNAKRELSEAENERDAVARDIDQVHFRQTSIASDITTKKKQATDYSIMVKKEIDAEIEEYDTILNEAQSQVDFARDESKGLGGLADYFGQVLDAAHKHHTCRLCQRPFKNASDPALEVFKKRMKNLIAKVAADAEVADMATVEARLKQVLDMGLPVATWKRLTEVELPALEKESAKLSQHKDSLLKKIDKHDNVVQDRRSEWKEFESIAHVVSSISSCQTDITSFTEQIEELSAKQSQQGSIKTLEDIQEELNQVTEDIQTITRRITRLTTEQNDAKTQSHELEIELRDRKNELSTITSELERKANLVGRVEEFRTSNQKQRESIEKIDKDIETIEPQITIAQAKLENLNKRWNAQIEDLTREASQLSETVNRLNLLNEQIKSYFDHGGPNQLSTVGREITNVEQEIRKADTAQAQLTREINQIEDQLRDSDATKRQYTDNINFRQGTQRLKQLLKEIAELESQNADVDRDRFEEESKRYKAQYHKQSAAREGHLGAMKTKDLELQQLLKDYETDFKDAPKRYKEAHIKVETTKAAIEDLARYATALDKAVMQFHSLKMAQINDIVGDLWQKTYQGTDVDGIMIRSDAESNDASNAKATATTTSRRQYQYRVAMNKQGVEMDMRGRCSAGQRVLACIIIRLAIAEVFSSNCGIIALDEPTTNLDKDNIQALAKSLHDIIKTRKRQSNFQLLVITHDEDFLRTMNCSDFTDYYYRVSRDGAGDSIIERQDILEVDR